jgi:hypothetical protein
MHSTLRTIGVLIVLSAAAMVVFGQCATCILFNESIKPGPVRGFCPYAVNLTSSWMMNSPSNSCTFSCTMFNADGTFTKVGCGVSTTSIGGQFSGVMSLLQATFHATDCNTHYVQVLTTVVESDGTIATYPGGRQGYSCTTYGIGNVRHSCL